MPSNCDLISWGTLGLASCSTNQFPNASNGRAGLPGTRELPSVHGSGKPPTVGFRPKTGCASARGRSVTPLPPLTEDAAKPTGRPGAPALPRAGGSKARVLGACCSCLNPCWVCTVVPVEGSGDKAATAAPAGVSGGTSSSRQPGCSAPSFPTAHEASGAPCRPQIATHEGGIWTLQRALHSGGGSHVQR